MTSTLMDQQIELEAEMVGLGLKAYQDRVIEARTKGRESETKYGNMLVRMVILPLAETIAEFKAKAASGAAGRRHTAVRYLNLIENEVAAYLIARTVMNGISTEGALQSVALAVGNSLEDEVRFAAFEAQAAGMFTVVRRDLDKRTSSREWKRRVLMHSMNKLELDWEPWPGTERFHLGQKCIDLFIQATGLARVATYKVGPKRTKVTLTATQDTMDFIEKMNGRCELLCPSFLPCVVPPKPWTGPRGGGYYTMDSKVSLVKTRNAYYLEELANHVDDMPLVYEAVNAMQDTAWKINTPVLNTLRAVWFQGLQIGGLPRREKEDLPAKPINIADDEEARQRWKRMASQTHEGNARNMSKRLQIDQIVWIADKYREFEAIYFPHQLDFRGRAYAMPMFLTPQGADWSKALLTFAHGKPITDERGAGWLMVQGANTFGVDKVCFEDRIAWVEEHHDAILRVANDPLVERWWDEADKPWQFLAFCFEYAAFQAEGYGFVSCLPIALDGSCNGLQHYSAMLRDEVGGRAVNLVPGEKPEDIYQQVADVVVKKLMHKEGWQRHPDEQVLKDALLAKQWLAFGVDRKATKRPVMVLPYGGTLRSCRQYTYDYVRERAAAAPCLWDADQQWEAAMFLSSIVWESIGEVVIAARAAMSWLQKVTGVVAKEGLPITWTTPDGLPVMQAYQEVKASRIKTKMGDSTMHLTLSHETKELDKARQRNGVAPNFVHSMDAAALRLYVTLAQDNGLSSFSLVHDSFGTLAADTDVSAACLRHAFVEMYSEHDVLAEFRAGLVEMLPAVVADKLPMPPRKGSLDLEAVRESSYFFA